MRSVLLLAIVVACAEPAAPANTIAFDFDGELFDAPWPSDLRLTAEATLDLSVFPNRRELPIVEELLVTARQRAGFPVMPIGYVRFMGEPPVHVLEDVLVDGPALLIDLERGTTYPVVAQTLVEDAFTGEGLVAIAPRPGIVLAGGTRHAFVLLREFAPGVIAPPAFTSMTPAIAEHYAPLWPVLDELGIARADVLVASVFTTGDEVAV